MVLHAMELLDEVELGPAAAWAGAEPVVLPGVDREIRRALIEAGSPAW